MSSEILEEVIHAQIAQYLNMIVRPPSRWHTIEVSNQQSGRAAMFRQIKLKKRGVVTGWPDIAIYWVRPGNLQIIFMEVKSRTGKLTPKQEKLHEELKSEGHHVYIVRSVDNVTSALKSVGFL